MGTKREKYCACLLTYAVTYYRACVYNTRGYMYTFGGRKRTRRRGCVTRTDYNTATSQTLSAKRGSVSHQ